ncbi:MAG: hypothetical protein KAS93_04450 [Gammaproteobacteria bacterium]|nr:hypothetical protein [Gammaproteobacteria bacterium]
MKLISKLTIIVSVLAVFGIAPLQNVFAQGGSGSEMSVLVQGYGGDALNQLYDGVGVQFYNLLLKAYTKIAYETDPQVATIINYNAASKASADNAASAVTSAAQTAIQNAFASIDAKAQIAYKLQQVLAGDDVIDVSGAGSALSNIFSSGANTLSIKQQNDQAKQNNAMFDVESLVGPSVYDSSAKLNSANGFLAEMNSIAQPIVIRLAPTFKVPVGSGDDTMTIGKKTPLSASDLAQLQQTLQQKPAYRKYRVAYRQLIATRSIFVNNLLHVYQARVAQKDTEKSAYQIRNEVVGQRMSPTYYQAMAKASPATVARETLFLLAQISAQLNAVQNQNERMITMKSISGLITLSATSRIMEQSSKQVGQIIYCAVPANKDKDACKSGGTPNSLLKGMASQ